MYRTLFTIAKFFQARPWWWYATFPVFTILFTASSGTFLALVVTVGYHLLAQDNSGQDGNFTILALLTSLISAVVFFVFCVYLAGFKNSFGPSARLGAKGFIPVNVSLYQTPKTRIRDSKTFFILETFVILVTIVAFWLEFFDRSIERENAAWQVLALRSSGNSGKVDALEFLKTRQATLRGLNLSCESNEGGWNADLQTCGIRPYLTGLDLSPTFWNTRVSLNNSNFSGADLQFAKFINADLGAVDFSGAMIISGKFSNSTNTSTKYLWTDLINADFSGASFIATNFRDARLQRANFENAEFTNPDLRGANISGANFIGAKFESDDFKGTWAWRNEPPKFSNFNNFESFVVLCNPAFKTGHYNSQIFRGHFDADRGKPEVC